MLQELFNQERKTLNTFFESLDIQAIESLVDLLYACKGSIIISGVGKSGLVAEKVAQTLTSTGSHSIFLSSSNALHGDIGIVRPGDIFMMLSKSGESDELLHLLPFIKNRGVKVIAVVCNPNSQLAKKADICITLPIEEELCPFDLAPTTSTVIQMIFGDVIAVALMKRRNFKLEEYALNHPAGKIGRRLSYRVKDLMLTGHQIPLVAPHDLLGDILVELSNKECGCVLIVDEHKMLKGIFTDGDLRRTLQKFGGEALKLPIEKIMTVNPRSTMAETMAVEALALMERDVKRPIMVLAVLDSSTRVVGLLKMHHLIQAGL